MFINNCSLFSHRRVGPSLHTGSLSGSTAVGFGWCCLYGLHKTSCANKHTHTHTHTENGMAGKGNGVVTDRSVEFQVDSKANTHSGTDT